jgi:hypothetical protein
MTGNREKCGECLERRPVRGTAICELLLMSDVWSVTWVGDVEHTQHAPATEMVCCSSCCLRHQKRARGGAELDDTPRCCAKAMMAVVFE